MFEAIRRYWQEFFGVFSIIWNIAEPLGLNTGWKLLAQLMLLAYAIGISVILWKHKRANKPPSHTVSNHLEQSIISELLQDKTELRIFASGSENYRNTLVHALKMRDPSNQLRIKVLMRTDGSTPRIAKIEEAKAKWLTDVDNKYNATTEIRLYDSKIMLRGIIIESKAAILGWYYRKPNATLGMDYPSWLLTSQDAEDKKIIEFAKTTFDGLFDNAQQA